MPYTERKAFFWHEAKAVLLLHGKPVIALPNLQLLSSFIGYQATIAYLTAKAYQTLLLLHVCKQKLSTLPIKSNIATTHTTQVVFGQFTRKLRTFYYSQL